MPGATTTAAPTSRWTELVGVKTRQVFDTLRCTAHVTEHQMQRRRGRGGQRESTSATRGNGADFCGPRVDALACYLAVYEHLPYERMAEPFSDRFGIEISVGALAKMVTEAGRLLGIFTDVVADLLRFAPAVHFDETHKRRGKVAIDAMGIMERMSGVAVHDRWAPYRTDDVVHGLCNAHHVRELGAQSISGKDHRSCSTIGRLCRRSDVLVPMGRGSTRVSSSTSATASTETPTTCSPILRSLRTTCWDRAPTSTSPGRTTRPSETFGS